MKNPWWVDEYAQYFAPDFRLEMPFAPPGMEQNLGAGQILAHKIWLNRTVKNFAVRDAELYGPRDPFGDKFVVVRYMSADVCWGGRDGRFESRSTTLLTIKNGAVQHMKEWFNPLAFLKAAGLEVPNFKQELDRSIENKPLEPREFDMSPEAISERATNNVLSFIDTDSFSAAKRRIQSDDFRHAIWNAPPEMKEEYELHEYAAMDAWVGGSLSKGWYGHPDMIMYATDNPHVFFLEAGGYGTAEWIGNGESGGYGNRYIKYIEIDDAGLLRRWDENLNPICKFNSINVSLPTFPYLY